ncbi:hypothetical protein vseg_008874 [Gypsophila vaccaria]
MGGIVGEMETKKEPASLTPSQTTTRESEIRSQVDAVWEKMNKGVSTKTLNSIVNKHRSTGNTSSDKSQASHNWMSFLGMRSNRTEQNLDSQSKNVTPVQKGTSDEAKKLAAIALASAKAPVSAAAMGKIEVTEKRDFAGEEVEIKRLVDSSSKEATEKPGASSAVDAILEQIKKKPKLNLLDKTKKDWGEFKEENKGLEDELDAYKKSANQYLDKVSFLHRADYREYERERDVRLAQQAKRRLETREDP